MRVPGRYARARHILVGTKAEAQSILDEITKAKKPFKVFKKMARDYSTCSTSAMKSKGHLNFLSKYGNKN